MIRTAPLTAIVALACITEISAPSPELPEARGTPLATGISSLHRPAWAPDGLSIIAVSDADEPMLLMVSIAGGDPLTLDGPRTGYADLTVTDDAFLFSGLTGGAWQAVRLPRTGGEPIELGVTPGGDATGARILPAPRSDSVAVIIAPDSLFLVALEGRRFIADGCERLVAFAPDGARLLCSRGSGTRRTFLIVDLVAGTRQNVTLLPAGAGTLVEIAWPIDGLRVLFTSDEGWSVRDVEAGTSTLIYSRERPTTALDTRFAAWSRDGRRVAFWTHDCLAGGTGTCDRAQSVIRVVDLATLAVDVAAVIHSPEPGASLLVFSPDGSRIAWLFADTLAFAPTS